MLTQIRGMFLTKGIMAVWHGHIHSDRIIALKLGEIKPHLAALLTGFLCKNGCFFVAWQESRAPLLMSLLVSVTDGAELRTCRREGLQTPLVSSQRRQPWAGLLRGSDWSFLQAEEKASIIRSCCGEHLHKRCSTRGWIWSSCDR